MTESPRSLILSDRYVQLVTIKGRFEISLLRRDVDALKARYEGYKLDSKR